MSYTSSVVSYPLSVPFQVRLQPQFKEMWLLIRGLIDSLSTLFWTYVIISWTLYIFAIASVTLLARDADFKDDEVVQEQFGGVLSSMSAGEATVYAFSV